MRKMTMMCMAALLLMAVSCKKEKANEEYTGEGFRATTESHTGEGDSKTQLNSDLSVTWCDGDVIKVFSNTDSNGKKFSAASAGTAADFNPKEDVTDAFFAPPYTAFYPESAVRGTNQIYLDGTQHYTKNDDVLTFAPGENPMAATSTTTELSFKNLCGILKFQLYSASSCKVKTLCVTSLKSGEQLWGTGTVTFDDTNDDTNATLDALTGGTGSITLDCSNKVVELGTVDAPTEFMFVIPAGALSEGFTVTVTDDKDKVWSKTTTASNTITKSKIKAMPKQAVETKPDIPDDALPGLFSVSDTKQVYFSKGNLQFIGRTGKWKFADHQYDFIGNEQNNSSASDIDRDLFGWGCTGSPDDRSDARTYQTNYQPYSTSKTGVNSSNPAYKINRYGYGPDYVLPYYNLTVNDKSDWGCLEIGEDPACTWRTLTAGDTGEWNYLLKTRNMKYDKPRYTNKTGGITIGGKTYNGLFIYPDDYNGVEVGKVDAPATWDEIDALGIVFLPAAGYRDGTSVYRVGSYCDYWSSSYINYMNAYSLHCYSSNVGPSATSSRYNGYSVRLVTNAN